MNNDNILAAISKVHAYRYAKEKQRGVLTTNGGFSTTDPALLQVPCTIQCVVSPDKLINNAYAFSSGYVYLTTADANRMRITTSGSGTNESTIFNVESGSIYNVTFVLSVEKTSAYVNGELVLEVNGSEDLKYYVLGCYTQSFINRLQGGYLLHRHFNYAMTADEVKALDNNGDPMGYVVPKTMRERGPEWAVVNNIIEIGLDDTTQVAVTKFLATNKPYLYELQFRIDECEYTPDSGYRALSAINASILGGDVSFSNSDVGKTLTAIIKTFDIEGKNNQLYFYVGSNKLENYTTRNLKISILSLRPVGLLVEYLPQNLMESREGPEVEPKAKIYEFNTGDSYYRSVISEVKYPFDCIYRVDYVVNEWDYQPRPYGVVGFLGLSGATIIGGTSVWDSLEQAKAGELQSVIVKMPGTGNPALYIYGGNDNEVATARHLKVTIKGITPISVASTWLDSAKQLPWSDAYLPPLLQSKGGYDMVANGAPEILFKDTIVKLGVKLGYNQLINDSAIKFQSPSFSIGTDDFSVEYYGNSFGSNFNNGSRFITSVSKNFGAISTSDQNGVFQVTLGDNTRIEWLADSLEEKFYLVVTRQGTTVKVYINGELNTTIEQSEVKDLGDLQLVIANSSDVGFVRVWNYALSQEEVTTLYNKGNPSGYIIPKDKKLPNLEFPVDGYTESSGTYFINSHATSATYMVPQANGFSGNYMRFESETFVYVYNAYWLNYINKKCAVKVIAEYRSNCNVYSIIATGKLVAEPNEDNAKQIEMYLTNGSTIVTESKSDAWLELRVISIEAVGCIAEYLAQNIVADPSDINSATGWLDSAKQLPVNDSSLSPLEQSIGGYDMTASNKPQIIYKSI